MMYPRMPMPNPMLEGLLANEQDGIGYIAVHPERGIFLGVDEDKQAVFQNPLEVEPFQPVPAFFRSDNVTIRATADTDILDCTLYKVEGVDKDNGTVLAEKVVNEDGSINSTDKGHFEEKIKIFNSKLDRAFHRAVHALIDWTSWGEVPYQKPSQQARP